MVDKEKTGSELRDSQRIPHQIRGTLKSPRLPEKSEVMLLNISINGILVKTTDRFNYIKGENIELLLWLPFLKPQGDEFQLIGREVTLAGRIQRVEEKNNEFLLGIQIREDHQQSMELVEETWLSLMFEQQEDF